MLTDHLAKEHESAFVNAFILRELRERYRTQLSSRKKRGSLLDRLNHRFIDDLDDRYLQTSPKRTIPAPDQLCYLISSESQYDGRLVPCSDVSGILRSAQFGIIVSYIPGKLAAYKDEAPAGVIWMDRP
jgi:hypothetical protein